MLRRVELRLSEHQQYQTAVDEYTTWLDGAAEKLQTLHNSAGTREDIENRLTKIRVGVFDIRISAKTCQCLALSYSQN